MLRVNVFDCKLSRKWDERSSYPGHMVQKPEPDLIGDLDIEFNQRRDIQQLNNIIFLTTFLVIIFIIMGFILGPKLIVEDSEELEYYHWSKVPLKERYQLDLNLTSWPSQLPESVPY